MYAVHAVGRDNHFAGGETAFLSGEDDLEQFNSRPPEALADYKQYVLGQRPLFGAAADEARPFFIDVNPARPLVAGWGASLVNDGASSSGNGEDAAVNYYANSRPRKNCAIVPFGPAPLVAYATTRDVQEGEEFLTTYGADYWLPDLEATPRVVELARETATDAAKAAAIVAETYLADTLELDRMFVELASGGTI